MLSLAAGIAGSTAMFSLLHTVLLERLAIPHPEQLVAIRPERTHDGGTRGAGAEKTASASMRGGRVPLGVPTYDALARTAPTRLEAFTTAVVSVRVGNAADYPGADFVSGGDLDLLGVPPERGRLLTAADAQRRAPVAVISRAYWLQFFNGAPDVIGRVIDVEDLRVTIVGVMPARYRGLYFARAFTVALPLSLAGIAPGPYGDDVPVTVVARRPAATSVGAVGAMIDLAYQRCCASGWTLAAQDASRGLQWAFDPRRDYGTLLRVLMAGVSILLIVSCANVALLLLGRAVARRRELAIRLALGASRARIARHLAMESIWIALIGTVLGVVTARAGTVFLARHLPGTVADLGDIVGLRATPAVLAFTVVTAVLCTFLFGTWPAMRAARTDLRESMFAGRRDVSLGRRWPIDRLLVVAQVASSVVLLSGAGLFVVTLRNLERGVRAYGDDRVLLVDVDTRMTPYQHDGIPPLSSELLARVRRIPGVRSAAMALTTPLFGRARMVDRFDTAPGPSTGVAHADVDIVTPAYFDATDIPVLRGREFADDDLAADAGGIALVSESFATAYFGTRDVVGREIGRSTASGSDRLRIIGGVGDARYMDLREGAQPTVYTPMRNDTTKASRRLGEVNLVVRTDVEPAAVAAATRQAIVQTAPGIRVRRLQTLDEAITDALPRERMAAALASIFGLIALALALTGLYGVITYDVERPTSELGILMALGATSAAPLWLVLRQTLELSAIGVILGAVVTLGAGRWLGSQLYGIAPGDPRVLVGSAVMLVCAAVAASIVPSARAARVDPIEALRAE
jgi:predicted permease